MKVEISTPGGNKQKANAVEVEGTKGRLCIVHGTVYSITHVGSGKRLGHRKSLKKADRAAKKLWGLMNKLERRELKRIQPDTTIFRKKVIAFVKRNCRNENQKTKK